MWPSKRFRVLLVGTRWRHIGGRLKRVEAGPNGVVWGVNKRDYIYFRAGITRRNPIGRHWVSVRGRLNYVAAGCSGVYGVSRNQQVWRYRGKYKNFVIYQYLIYCT